MTGAGLDEVSSKLLAELRGRFPLVERPFQEIGHRLGMSEAEAMERTKALVREGVIRRIGYMPGESLRRSRATTLVGMKVPKERIETAAGLVNARRGVSHNYLREHELNLWFTLSAPDKKRLEMDLQEVLREVRPEEWVSLPAVRMFKLNAPSGPGHGPGEDTR
jgi:DNA-binding Lrp family transcriptional regulator